MPAAAATQHPGQIFPGFDAVYQLIDCRTIADQLSYDWIWTGILDGMRSS